MKPDETNFLLFSSGVDVQLWMLLQAVQGFIHLHLFSSQLEHARLTQTDLMRESFRRNQEINELLQKQEELQERVNEEARAREQLALELHRAESEIRKVPHSPLLTQIHLCVGGNWKHSTSNVFVSVRLTWAEHGHTWSVIKVKVCVLRVEVSQGVTGSAVCCTRWYWSLDKWFVNLSNT